MTDNTAVSTQHTPGPWKTGAGNFGLIKAGRTVIAETRGNSLPPGEELANAKLLANAPALLAALNELQKDYCHFLCLGLPEYHDEVCDDARAAIEKARA